MMNIKKSGLNKKLDRETKKTVQNSNIKVIFASFYIKSIKRFFYKN